MGKKRFFANHAKSSAAVISIAIHALLLVVAVSFVAVTVYKKPEQEFEAKPLNRENVQLKKLKVPVKARKKNAPKPKLTKRIMADTKFKQSVPDIKIPDIMGVKGGVSVMGGGGLDGDGSLGFAMPEIKIFGVKTRGEKVFIILDSNPRMMYDKMGGIPAYTLIKKELVTILGNLSPTVLFNIAVYDHNDAVVLFPQMVPANNSNVSQVEEWLAPLNAVDVAKSKGKYGPSTLSSDIGTRITYEGYAVPPLERTRFWSTPMMVAMQQQADAVFVLAEGWNWQMHVVGEDRASEKIRAEYEAIQARAKEMYDKENAERLRKGKIPLVLTGHGIAKHYFPEVDKPQGAEQYHYSSKELAKAFVRQRKESAAKKDVPLELSKKGNKIPFTFSVIHFVPQGKEDGDGDNFGGHGGNFRELSGLLGGEYRTLAGMDAIRSSATQ